MIEILIITVAILTLLIVALITFIFYQNKNNKTPEFTTLQKEITIKDDYITELKKDKQLLIDNSKIAIDLTKKNLNLIRAQKFAEIYNLDFRNLKFTPFSADIFFLDPPYNKFKISEFLKKYPNVELKLREMRTERIIQDIKEKKIEDWINVGEFKCII